MSELTSGNEPLPGYTVIDRVGAGGYGDVYRVSAPGGLTKAVKVIRGRCDDRRASSELKALERIRDVRHPFLLSLERIEVVDDKLVIVTELADQCLNDRFLGCTQKGKAGIPRDELLKYVRDAADALDFMSEEFALQHLDIKPENLLLLAGHIKVADFGLVKNLHNLGVSMVGGLTPLYAAPEVFRGSPSRHSDQYSLAVVYQQMLTGRLPFGGKSAAELTLQHLNDEPDLSALPEPDRHTVSRALAKNPDRRFESCGALVEALLSNAAQGAAPHPPGNMPVPPADTHGTAFPTQVIEPHPTEAARQNSLVLPRLPQLSVTPLQPPSSDPADYRPVPTLLLGIGGAAARVLRHVRRRLARRFGDLSQIPAIQTLLIDTDATTLLEATRGEAAALRREETLALSLRRPQEYRAAGASHLRWISRRWLYNIPRSLRTEGLRPLGRLALIDHFRQTRDRLQQALMQAVDAQSVAISSQSTHLPFEAGSLRVYVISSISGGTGSGMVLDISYLLRSLLEKLGLPQDQVLGILMHVTSRSARAHELAMVNAFSFLTELNHYHRPGAAFPGDEAAGLPPLDTDEHALKYTYLVHLGDGLEDPAFEAATQAVAEYVHLDGFTPAQAFLDACRNDQIRTPEALSTLARLRTFGICKQTATEDVQLEHGVTELCQSLIRSWLHRPDDHDTDGRVAEVVAPEAAAPLDDRQGLVAKLQLDAQGLSRNASRLVHAELGVEVEAFFARLASEVQVSDPGNHRRLMLQAIDRVFGGPLGACQAPQEGQILQRELETIVDPLTNRIAAGLRRWIWRHLDTAGERWPGAVAAVEWLTAFLRHAEGEIRQAVEALSVELAGICTQGTSKADRSRAASSTAEQMLPYFQRRMQHAGVQAALGMVLRLKKLTLMIGEQLVEAERQISHLADLLREPESSLAREPASGMTNDMRRSMARLLAARETDLVAQLDRQVQETFTQRHGGLGPLLVVGGNKRSELVARVRRLARQLVADAVNAADLGDQLLGGGDGAAAEAKVRAMLAAANPEFAPHGGATQHLTLLPAAARQSPLKQTLGEALAASTAVEVSGENELLVCCETNGVSLVHVAMDMIQGRRDYADYASRVHTRTDVPWSSLTAAANLVCAQAASISDSASTPPTVNQMLDGNCP